MSQIDVNNCTQSRLSETEARRLTDESRNMAEALWDNLLRLHSGKAHLALGYRTWEGYCEGEFGISRRRAYQLIDAARVLDEVTPAGFRGEGSIGSGLLNEAQARELAPVLRNAPGAVKQMFDEAQAEHGPKPTAKQIREVVKRHAAPVAEAPAPEPSWIARVRLLVDELQFIVLDPKVSTEKIDELRNLMADVDSDLDRLRDA